MSPLGISVYPYEVAAGGPGRPSSLNVVGSTRWMAATYGVSRRTAYSSRAILQRIPLMLPEARKYMLKLVREGR